MKKDAAASFMNIRTDSNNIKFRYSLIIQTLSDLFRNLKEQNLNTTQQNGIITITHPFPYKSSLNCLALVFPKCCI